MSRAAVNRYAAIVLLSIAILSAIALKLSLSSFVAEPDVITPTGHRVVVNADARV
jgi:general stress protein CsbA